MYPVANEPTYLLQNVFYSKWYYNSFPKMNIKPKFKIIQLFKKIKPLSLIILNKYTFYANQ